MPQVRRTAVLLLSFAAGLSDAFAFLALGGIFTANMTGNVVLSALFTHHAYGRVVAGAAGAIAAFAVGAYLTFRAWGRRKETGAKHLVSRGLVPAVLVELGVAALWTVGHGPHTADLVRVLVVMGSAFVMGVQSAVMKRSAHGGIVTTTYVTGTIVGIMDDLARGRSDVRRRLASIGMLVLGAATGCVLTVIDERLAPWGCALALCAACVTTRTSTAGDPVRALRGLTDRRNPAPRP